MYLIHNYIKKHLNGHLCKHQKPNKHTCSKITLKLYTFLSNPSPFIFIPRQAKWKYCSPTPITTPLALQTLLKKLFLQFMVWMIFVFHKTGQFLVSWQSISVNKHHMQTFKYANIWHLKLNLASWRKACVSSRPFWKSVSPV